MAPEWKQGSNSLEELCWRPKPWERSWSSLRTAVKFQEGSRAFIIHPTGTYCFAACFFSECLDVSGAQESERLSVACSKPQPSQVLFTLPPHSSATAIEYQAAAPSCSVNTWTLHYFSSAPPPWPASPLMFQAGIQRGAASSPEASAAAATPCSSHPTSLLR